MKLSISNIGWTEEDDSFVYSIMKNNGFTGLEIAPTRIFPELPYSKLDEAKRWADKLKSENELMISSMQSIWYGRSEKLFGTEEERAILIDYTQKAVNFAEVIGCKNLVFGSPKNRIIPEGADESIAIDFFREVGEYAVKHGAIIGIEANPPIYNTNYINDTTNALKLIEQIDSEGIKLNLDVGTMIENGEDISVLRHREHLINHVHISEPGLKPIVQRHLHYTLSEMLRNSGYRGFISIEVGMQDTVSNLGKTMLYVNKVFGDGL